MNATSWSNNTASGPDPSFTVTTKSPAAVVVSVIRALSIRTNPASSTPAPAAPATAVVTVSGAGSSAMASTDGARRSRFSTTRPSLVAMVPRRRMLSPGNTALGPARIARSAPEVSATCIVESPNVSLALRAMPSTKTLVPMGSASASATVTSGKLIATSMLTVSAGRTVMFAGSTLATNALSPTVVVSTATR